VLFGPAGPDDLPIDERLDVKVRCAYLDCPEATLRERLEVRGVSAPEIEDEVTMAASLRASGWHTIEIHDRSPGEVAEDVTRWVRGCL
jgi:hypothetical protein